MVEKQIIKTGRNPLQASIDFSEVSAGSKWRATHIEEGEYLAKIVSVDGDPAKDGEPMWTFGVRLEGMSGLYPYYCKLVSNQAWKVRALLAAAGITVPSSVKTIVATKLVGKSIGVVMEDDEYNGRMKSVIGSVIPVDEVTGADLPDEPEDEDDEFDDEPPAPKTKRRKDPEPEPEDDLDEDQDDDDEEEEEAPAPPKTKRRTTRSKPKPVEDDDDEDLDLDDI